MGLPTSGTDSIIASATNTLDAAGALATNGSGFGRVGTGDNAWLVFAVQRNVNVSSFPNPLPSPLRNYRPAYNTLSDGSLLTPLYQADLFDANSRLFGIGALLTLGAINVWTCVSYIRRGQVKDKTLFYLLLASQVLLPICFFDLLVPFFVDKVSCSLVNIVAVVSTEISYAILITGILGLKAYRCLNRSRFVLITTWALQLAIFALFILDIKGIQSTRRISGSCNCDGKMKFMPIGLALTVLETLFLAMCFLYAVWKSSLYPAAQGRLSIAISEKYPPEAAQAQDTMCPVRRGWWDYVPRAPGSECSIRHENGATGHGNGGSGGADGQPRISDDSIVRRLRNSVIRFTGMDFQQQQATTSAGVTYTRKPSIPTDQPLAQPPRPSAPSPPSLPSEKEQLTKPIRYSMATMSEAATSARTTSVRSINFAPSAMSETSSRIGPLQTLPAYRKLNANAYEKDGDKDRNGRRRPESIQTLKLLPKIFQVRAVIKDEMIYTFIIMLSCTLSAILAFVKGKNNEIVFGPSIWLGANWAAISLLVMLTFSRVVRRHEREAILNSPSAFGGPFLRPDFGPSALAIARRRRDALAVAAATPENDNGSSLLSPFDQRTRRRKPRRSSWDYASYPPSMIHEDNASMRRREGLREWDEEKARRRREGEENENPFADWNAIDGDGDSNSRKRFGAEDYYGEDGDIGRRKGPFAGYMDEEAMLDADSVRNLVLQKPLVASPWIESPSFYAYARASQYLGEEGWIHDPANYRAGPTVVSTSTSARRGAVTTISGSRNSRDNQMGETNHPPIILRQPTPPHPPSPPRSHNGSSIEMHEHPRTAK